MRSSKRLLLALALLGVPGAAHARGQYLPSVPNADVNRCQTCHERTTGGNPWNPFGVDILIAGGADGPEVTPDNPNANWPAGTLPAWTAELCGADSDGDGQLNGEELGDPACAFVLGAVPARTTAISNPGDAASLSTDPTGVDPAEGEGEPAEGEGEGEGEGDAEGGCASTSPSSTSAGALVLLSLLWRRASTARGSRAIRTSTSSS